jgi:hypothetical protein
VSIEYQKLKLIMKKITLFSIIVNSFFSCFSQSANDTWTKDEKTQLANECISLLTTKYPNLSDDQKESVAICYANAIQSAYPKRSDWADKMEIEVKKVKSNTLAQCVKSGGVEPIAFKSEEVKAKKLEISKEYLVGAWKFGEEEYRFAESGTILYKNSKTNCTGTWTLDGRTIRIDLKGTKLGELKLGPCSKTKVFEILTYSENELKVNDNAEKKPLDLTRGK